jgi:hypothetical protein
MCILGAALLCCVVSCSRRGKVPGDILGVRKMSGILLDMQMAQAYNDSYVPGSDPATGGREHRLKEYYVQILMLHHTDREMFLKSYHFYEKHPDLMQKLYDLMQQRIDRKSAYLDSVEDARQRALHPYLRVHQVKDFLFRFRSFRDSVLPPARVFRPARYGIRPQPAVDAAKFLLPYRTAADSIPVTGFRVFGPRRP